MAYLMKGKFVGAECESLVRKNVLDEFIALAWRVPDGFEAAVADVSGQFPAEGRCTLVSS